MWQWEEIQEVLPRQGVTSQGIHRMPEHDGAVIWKERKKLPNEGPFVFMKRIPAPLPPASKESVDKWCDGAAFR